MFLEPTFMSIVVGKLRKGKLKNLERVEIKAWYLLIFAGTIQVTLSIIKKLDWNLGNMVLSNYFIYLHGFSYILMIICIISNLRKNSMKLFLIGIVLNFIVIFANGGKMPVSIEGIRGINNYIELPSRDFDIKHKSISSDTKFIYLADIILIPRPYPLPKILSIGDVFLMLGLFLFLQEAMVIDKSKIELNN